MARGIRLGVALVLALALAAPAGAATLALTDGLLTLQFSHNGDPLPPITVPARSGVEVSVSDATGDFALPASVFGPASMGLPATLFTGIPSISGLSVAGLANPSMAIAGGRATAGLLGNAYVNVLQFAALPIFLSVVGEPIGMTAMCAAGAIICTYYSAGPWTTGVVRVTAFDRGETPFGSPSYVLYTVTLTGSDSRGSGHTGSMTLVAGFHTIISVGIDWPGFASMQLHWSVVPEPGTGLLLGAGSVGLALVARRRTRRQA